MRSKNCCICKTSFEENKDNFPYHNKSKNTFSCRCHTCKSLYRREHYKKNITHVKNVMQIRREKIEQLVIDLKSGGCSICSEKRHWVLDFHHRDKKEKEYQMAEIIKDGSVNKIIKEAEKCDIVCANCHRDLHYKERLQLKQIK